MKRCIIIAEAGVNHNGNMKLAKKLIDVAANSGADFIIFQTFKTENVVTKKVAITKYQRLNQKKNQTQYEMIKKLEIPFKKHLKLISYCKKIESILISTSEIFSNNRKLKFY